MRIRYKMANEPTDRAICDLTDSTAKRKYKEICKNGFCEWAELVGEEDHNYMDVLEQYDNSKTARMIYSIMNSMFK